ncbi:MAG: 2-hydroxyacyl-CoA dehydratase [Erysipelotrichaceae bacterium]|nr:2-hydroxyacyl-CoA dehydratase [Erysipelotrichaceae bacterium]
MDKYYVEFTKEMKDSGYTILCPTMLPLHFELLINIFRNDGYNIVQLRNQNSNVIAQGLRNTHNDTCYPALLVIGQFIDALESGEYDPHKVALLMTQTGGGCRASNYISLIRKALKKSGYEYIPVISLNVVGLEKHSGFKLKLGTILKMLYAVMYGDILMNLSNQCRPYEVNEGETDRLANEWTDRLVRQINSEGISYKRVKENYKLIINDFKKIERRKEDKVKVGVVGEIYVKYSPLANSNLEKVLQSEGAEVVVPGLLDFVLYSCQGMFCNAELYGEKTFSYPIVKWVYKWILKKQKDMLNAIKEDGTFRTLSSFDHTSKLIDSYISIGGQMGEGWLLTAEMLELNENGIHNIVCTQPFGCLPNHIFGKGMMKTLKQRNPDINIVAIDYDASASEVNQINRIKLMLANGKDAMKRENG